MFNTIMSCMENYHIFSKRSQEATQYKEGIYENQKINYTN